MFVKLTLTDRQSFCEIRLRRGWTTQLCGVSKDDDERKIENMFE